ncbi:LytR C-terminal domain-containing protein [Arthrobacter cryoconiti]|uniref:LytR C-terminal domain-containing protein n=1 Tax=Arthrobacter cryoconiti TaxID=748907 RepID=A0ABV8QXP6_9MICC|nr:LytR C-terminal domain-containing protein [Arthrobacter cryoconiti]MCC9068871.1 LytR C-terminal domain-containing protein [Arthrobacter cryoconiti]
MANSRYTAITGCFLGASAIVGCLLAVVTGVGINATAGKYLPAVPAACPTELLKPTALPEISLKVYNASTVDGLAADAAKSLQSRGIKILSLGNMAAPVSVKTATAVIIVAPQKNLAQAAALQALYPESVFLLDESDPATRLFLTKEDLGMSKSDAPAQTTLRCVDL